MIESNDIQPNSDYLDPINDLSDDDIDVEYHIEDPPNVDGQRKPLVAIVGRPNVGKSRLFNQLSETSQAIVHDFEGVTRDRQYADAEWFGHYYTVIDTGGFVVETEEPILTSMRNQAQLAIEEADAIIMLLDARSGLLASDHDIVAMLRLAEKKVFYAVNKLDTPEQQLSGLADFYPLGVPLYPISAEHGHGIDPLMDDVVASIPDVREVAEHPPYIRIAVVGKPNVGKSTTVNALLGEQRLLTSDTPGTTRDAIHTYLSGPQHDYLIIDTAGLRRKSTVSARIETYSVVQALRSIELADIVLLVIDATQGVSNQDKKIANVALNRGCGIVVIVNKWDLVPKDSTTSGTFVKELKREMPFLEWAPILFTSAMTGQRVNRILSLVNTVFENLVQRISTARVNEFIERVVVEHSPPIYRNRRLKFYYASQVSTRPPTFMFVVNRPEGLNPSYRRYLVNQLRMTYGFEGVPIKTVVRARKGHDDYED